MCEKWNESTQKQSFGAGHLHSDVLPLDGAGSPLQSRPGALSGGHVSFVTTEWSSLMIVLFSRYNDEISQGSVRVGPLGPTYP